MVAAVRSSCPPIGPITQVLEFVSAEHGVEEAAGEWHPEGATEARDRGEPRRRHCFYESLTTASVWLQ